MIAWHHGLSETVAREDSPAVVATVIFPASPPGLVAAGDAQSRSHGTRSVGRLPKYNTSRRKYGRRVPRVRATNHPAQAGRSRGFAMRWVRAAWITAPVFALLSSCMSLERDADLAPTNDQAAAIGTLRARFIAHGTGNGEAELTMPDGVTMAGLYHIDRDPLLGFGDVIVAALTKEGTAAMLTAIGGIQEVSAGTVTVSNPNGAQGSCEFYNNNISGHGFGACELSNGALYRLQY